MTEQNMTPDPILHRGLFATLDRIKPTACAVAVKDGAFVAGERADSPRPSIRDLTTLLILHRPPNSRRVASVILKPESTRVIYLAARAAPRPGFLSTCFVIH